MSNFYPTVWNILHDGIIVAIEGEVPGSIRLHVSIDYLRERFSDSGDTIQILLAGCTRFAYREFDTNAFTTDLAVIAAMEPEVLSATLTDGLCEVECAGGMLEVAAVDGWVSLDSGRSVTLQELVGVSEAYWKQWSERAKQARQKPS